MNKFIELKKFFFGKECSFAYAINAFLLSLIPEDFFRIDCAYSLMKRVIPSTPESFLAATIVLSRILLCLIVLLAIKWCYRCWKKKRRKVEINDLNYSIDIEYGDINECCNGKKVINFDELDRAGV